MSTLFYVSYVALWVLLLTMGVLVLLLYRHFGMMSLGTLEGVQRDGLPIGSARAPNQRGHGCRPGHALGGAARPAPTPPLRRPRLRAVRHRPPPRRALGASSERRPRHRGRRAGTAGRSGPLRQLATAHPFPPWPRTAAAPLPATGCASPRSGSSSARTAASSPRGSAAIRSGCARLLEAADLRDIARSLPAPAQPVKITPRNPVPAGHNAAGVAASNGIEGTKR